MTKRSTAASTGAYFPALDGMRGMAVLAVFAFHLEDLVPDGSIRDLALRGWIGVDIFFTLSGFLITWLLLQEQARTGRIATARFYGRRALRLFPAYFLVIAATTAVLVLHGSGTQPQDALNALPWLLTYTSNFAAAAGIALPLTLHTWSLAIEEQYYLAYPWIVRNRTPARLLAMLCGLVAAIVTIRGVGFYAWPFQWPTPGTLTTSVYFLTPFRIDSILVGGIAAAALAVPELESRLRQRCAHPMAAPAVFLSLLVAILFLADHQRPRTFVWGLPLINLLTAAVIVILMCGPGSRIQAALSATWLVWIGKISYGIYLLHPLAISATKDLLAGQSPGSLQTATLISLASLGLTLVAAQMLRVVVEAPFLKLKETLR